MSVLDQVMELKSKGMAENEIIASLIEHGVSPNSITDALSQARIKSAVSSESMNENNEEMETSIMRPERAESLPTEGSISDEDLTPPTPSIYQMQTIQRGFVPMHREATEEEYAPPQESYPSGQPQEYPSYQPYLPPEEQQTPEYGYPPQATDTDTIIEIAEQVFSEKIKSIQKHLEDLNEFKTLMQSRVENISDRLKRIEASIDRLQAEILEKIGSYGRGLDTVNKEMSMMQDSFGKVVGSLAERAEYKHHVPLTQHPSPSSHIPAHIVQKIEKKIAVVHKSGKKHSKKKK